MTTLSRQACHNCHFVAFKKVLSISGLKLLEIKWLLVMWKDAHCSNKGRWTKVNRAGAPDAALREDSRCRGGRRRFHRK